MSNNLLSIYDYENNKWYTAPGPECFRSIAWIYKDKVYVQGGLNNKNLIFENGEIKSYSLVELFKEHPQLIKKI